MHDRAITGGTGRDLSRVPVPVCPGLPAIMAGQCGTRVPICPGLSRLTGAAAAGATTPGRADYSSRSTDASFHVHKSRGEKVHRPRP